MFAALSRFHWGQGYLGRAIISAPEQPGSAIFVQLSRRDLVLVYLGVFLFTTKTRHAKWAWLFFFFFNSSVTNRVHMVSLDIYRQFGNSALSYYGVLCPVCQSLWKCCTHCLQYLCRWCDMIGHFELPCTNYEASYCLSWSPD